MEPKTGNIMRRHETGGADLGPGVRVIFYSAGANRPGMIEDAPRRLSPAGFLMYKIRRHDGRAIWTSCYNVTSSVRGPEGRLP